MHDHHLLPRKLQRSTCTFVQLQRLLCAWTEATGSALSSFQAPLNTVQQGVCVCVCVCVCVRAQHGTWGPITDVLGAIPQLL